MIHPSAIVSPDARIGDGVRIGPGAVVEAGAEIGDNSRVRDHAVVTSFARLGRHVDVHSFAVVGGPPQSIGFDESISSFVRIGNGTIVRESATVQRSMFENGETVVGERAFLMAYSHVGHDCRLGDHVMLANNVMLAGHVEVGRHVFIGGGTGVQQRTRIGEGVMLGGLVQVTQDIPPFSLCGTRNELSGLNLIGLKRRGVSSEAIAELKRLFVRVYCAARPLAEAAAALAEGAAATDEGRRFLEFFSGCKRGFSRPVRSTGTSGDSQETEPNGGLTS